jgi:LacI family transcriptional regulator
MKGVSEFADSHPECRIVHYNADGSKSMAMVFPVAEAIDSLRTKCPEMTAIFAFTDILALMVQSELQRSGMKIPEDISVIGYDNSDFSDLLSPGLTSVEEDAGGIAETVCQICRDYFSGKKIDKKTFLVRPALIESESVRNIILWDP